MTSLLYRVISSRCLLLCKKNLYIVVLLKSRKMRNTNNHFSIILCITFYFVTTSALHAQSLQGHAFIDSLKEDLLSSKADTSKIKTLYRLSAAYSENDSASALNYASQCMLLSKQINWSKGLGLAYLAYGRIYNTISAFALSLKNSDAAYAIFKSINNKRDMAGALKISGLNYEGLGNYAKSIEVNLNALKLYEDIDNKQGIEALNNNIGNVYIDISDFEKAKEYYQQSLLISKQLNNIDGIANSYGNIGEIYINENKFDSADKYNRAALNLYQQLNDSSQLCIGYYIRGNLLLKQKNAAAAYKFYNLSAAIANKVGAMQQAAGSYGKLTEICLIVGSDSSSKYSLPTEFKTNKAWLLQYAKRYITKAISLSKETGDKQLIMYNSNLASKIESALGNYRIALDQYQNYALYKDSIYNDANKKKIAALEMQRVTEVKNKEIQLLNQQKALETAKVKQQTLIKNIIIASGIILAILAFVFIRASDRRKKSLFNNQMMEVEMKALRAQMNPHFIFNSLQSINNYIIENDKQNASAYLSKFSKLIRLILENSREKEVPLQQDLQALELYMQMEALRFKNRFNYIIEADNDIDKENTLIPPMLLQPFVENAIVHGFKHTKNGVIKINVHHEDDMLRYVVEDNGSGRNNLAVNHEKDKQHKSLGLQIISERLNIINELKKVKTAINIFDVKDEKNNLHGLRIELLLPFEVAF